MSIQQNIDAYSIRMLRVSLLIGLLGIVVAIVLPLFALGRIGWILLIFGVLPIILVLAGMIVTSCLGLRKLRKRAVDSLAIEADAALR